MVRRVSKQGGVWHEPPYTEEEEAAFYRAAVGEGPFTFLHSGGEQPSPPAPVEKPQPPRKTPRRSPGK